MTIKKLEDGRYQVDIRPNGRNGKRLRKKFNKKQEAIAYEKYTSANYNNKEWLSKLADKRLLSELVTLWWEYHGKHDDHGKSQLGKLNRVTRMMKDPAAFQINKTRIATFRTERLSQGVKASTINRELSVMGGMFTDLIASGLYSGEHPLHGIGKLKQANTEMSYLSHEEISSLLSILDGDNRKVAILCLNTGARWGEAVKLKGEHVIHNRVTFVQTKNGKSRSVPISQEVAEQICTQKSGLLFPGACYRQFRQALKIAKPDLPHGQASHVLRHTFGTHFMISNGNIIVLQRILGHSKIEQTMTYAHFAPKYLQDAISHNPLGGKAHV
ncbi:tyrosine-type recombinase/integrase [Sodalis endosymbiont of Spalangia cameroni]